MLKVSYPSTSYLIFLDLMNLSQGYSFPDLMQSLINLEKPRNLLINGFDFSVTADSGLPVWQKKK